VKPNDNKFKLRSYRAAYGTTVLSITLVLFILGVFALVLIQARELTNFVRENIGLQIELNDSASDERITEIMLYLDDQSFTSRTSFISKEEAAKELAADLGEDFIDFIGYNPLPNTIELFLKSEYAMSDSIAAIRRQLLEFPEIRIINYQENLLELVNQNINRIGKGILFFAGLLLIVSVLLIHNTIRLAVYAKRLLIKSMLLVGATQWFIRKPFVVNGLLQGFVSGVLAVALLWSFVFFARTKIPELQMLEITDSIWLLSAAMIVFGLLVSWISTYFAIKKYLKINSEDLY
jgi:cell division transport system permease protein